MARSLRPTERRPSSGWRHVVSRFQKLHRYPKNPVRCCAPA